MKRILFCCFFLVSLCAVLCADVDTESGKLRLVIEDYDGSFFLYRKNVHGSYVSLLDAKRYSLNSGFYVLFEKNIQKLTRSGGVRIHSEKTEDGAKLVFAVKNRLVCKIDFTFFSSDGREIDSVRMDTSLLNIDDAPRLTGLKVVFDTWLGENSLRHFSTALRDSVTSECYFNDMSREQWIQSADGEVAMRLLLWGKDITKIQTAAIANKDVLAVPVWVPSLVPERKFDSIHSYNNSAVSVLWEPRRLNPEEELKVRFYITTAAGKRVPADIAVLKNPSLSHSVPDAYADDSTSFAAPPPQPDRLQGDSAAYIRSLLLRIRELEADPSSASADEISKLNAEVDAALLKLRQ